MSKTQAVLFKVDKGWTSSKARAWLKENKFKPMKRVHKSGNLLRYRILEPTFKSYITKSQKNGINFVIGINKKSKKPKQTPRQINKQKKTDNKRKKSIKPIPAGIKVSLST
tara:strand:+ start:1383 stop:1715 length:333 start_codon:yes stop_codon:yes gene_type:complete